MEWCDGKLTFFLLVSWFNVPNQLFYASILSPQILCCLLLLQAPPSCPVSQQLGEVVKNRHNMLNIRWDICLLQLRIDLIIPTWHLNDALLQQCLTLFCSVLWVYLKSRKLLIKDIRKLESLRERAMGEGNIVHLLLPMHRLG
jgi:hypothetical protein